MLTEYELNNFKPFGKPAVIPIKPITLIFGANSSGKSSIIQSLLMLKQTLDESGNSDVALLPKGKLVDLGNYREFIHCHDISKLFSFKMMFSINQLYDIIKNVDHIYNISDLLDKILKLGNVKYEDFFNKLGLSISFYLEKEPYDIKVQKVEIFMGNNRSPIYTYDKDKETEIYLFTPDFKNSYWKYYLDIYKNIDPEFINGILERSVSSPFPDEDDNDKSREEESIEEDYSNNELMDDIDDNADNDETEDDSDNIYIKAYSDFQFGGFDKLKNFLPDLRDEITPNMDPLLPLITYCLVAITKFFFDKIIYVPPLRDTPKRYYTYGEQVITDLLLKNDDLLQQVNSEIARLGIDYKIKIFPISSSNSDINDIYTIRLDSNGIDVSFKDVGFGVGQILPVIVTCMSSRNQNLIIEQPELHLHPALQAELGDMFIRSALGSQKNNFIIETHSEHLILRILRRIRETTEGKLPENMIPIKPEQVSVIYVQNDVNSAEAIYVPIAENGKFRVPWPKGFFRERAKELF